MNSIAQPDEPRFVQVALCTSNLPRSVQLYSEALGFRDAGGSVLFGELLGRIQQLGDDAAAVLWWLVGGQNRFQIELFSHTCPLQQPQPDDWWPCDHGWVRWGIEVADLDACLAALAELSITPLTAPLVEGLSRRVCIRDPWTAIPLEIIEAPIHGPHPRIVYGAVSVPDLDQARAFYVDAAGLEEDRETVLHTAAHEALWGLEGAKSESFLVRAGEVLLEVVRYERPVGRRRSPYARLSEQGFMHMAIGFREKPALEELADRFAAHGYELTHPLPPGGSGGTYVLDDTGLTIEIVAVPPALEAGYGFVAKDSSPFVEDGTRADPAVEIDAGGRSG